MQWGWDEVPDSGRYEGKQVNKLKYLRENPTCQGMQKVYTISPGKKDQLGEDKTMDKWVQINW